jgi:hypothetical protein
MAPTSHESTEHANGGGIAGEHRPAQAQASWASVQNVEPSGRHVGGRGSLAGSGRRRVDLGEQEGREACHGQGSCRWFRWVTWVLNQLLPARQTRLRPGLIDWGIPYSGSQFSVEFAFSLRRCTGGPGPVIGQLWGGSLGRALKVATFNRLGAQPMRLRCRA